MKMDWGKYEIDITRVSGGKTFCPKCHHTRKHKTDRSLSVDLKTGLFNCHNVGCEFSGCAGESPLLERNAPKKEYAKPQPRLQKVGDKMLTWFESRKISNDTLLHLKITEAQEWMPGCENGQTLRVICFNYYRCDELVNIKYRSGAKGFRLEKGAELIFYNLPALEVEGRKEVVIVEGEMDVATMIECGIYNVVSVPNGASIGKMRLEYLDNCWEYFEGMERIILATDGDDPGDALRQELARRLGAHRCFFVKYPHGCKDANEVLLQYGADAVRDMVKNAELPPLEGVLTVVDVQDAVRDLYLNGYPPTLRLGWKFDELLRWRLGEVTIITGTPNAGKSTWLNNVLAALAKQHKWVSAMFTPEKMPVSILIGELAQIHVGKPFYRADPDLKMSKDEVIDALNFIDSHFYFLKVDEVDATIDGLLEKAVECVKRYGINVFVIDPWNYLEHKRPPGHSETEYVSEALSKVARFAKVYNVHVFIIAHPTKIKKGKDGQYEVPNLYDISGSANFFNKTDNGVVLYRNYSDNCTDIYVQKIRWFFVGKIGQVRNYFNTDSQRFTDDEPIKPLQEVIDEMKMKNYMQQAGRAALVEPPAPENDMPF